MVNHVEENNESAIIEPMLKLNVIEWAMEEGIHQILTNQKSLAVST